MQNHKKILIINCVFHVINLVITSVQEKISGKRNKTQTWSKSKITKIKKILKSMSAARHILKGYHKNIWKHPFIKYLRSVFYVNYVWRRASRSEKLELLYLSLKICSYSMFRANLVIMKVHDNDLYHQSRPWRQIFTMYEGRDTLEMTNLSLVLCKPILRTFCPHSTNIAFKFNETRAAQTKDVLSGRQEVWWGKSRSDSS